MRGQVAMEELPVAAWHGKGDAMREPPSPLHEEEVLAAAVRQYFRADELSEARRMLTVGRTYEESIAYIAQSAEQELRDSGEPSPPHWILTIPGGTVFIYRPGHCFPAPPLFEYHVGFLAALALPKPETAGKAISAAPPKVKAKAKDRQLSFWEAEELPESMPSPPPKLPAKRQERPKRLAYGEQSIKRKHYPAQQGWVVKDCGLGYVLNPSGEGYTVTLIHLKSGRDLTRVHILDVNHERIREWVTTCALLTDWTRGIKAILAEKQGKDKNAAWARQLEAIWWQQKKVKRQLAFF